MLTEFIYQPDSDPSYPYTAWQFAIDYEAVESQGRIEIVSLRSAGLLEVVNWCDKDGSEMSPIGLRYREKIEAWFQRELDQHSHTYERVAEKCIDDYLQQLSYAG